MDAPALFVSKTTDVLERAVVIDNLQRLGAMTPVAAAAEPGGGDHSRSA